MTDYYREIEEELMIFADTTKAVHLSRFFKTGKGQYGEGDRFIGLTIPKQREIARKYRKLLTSEDILTLLRSEIHEFRMTALLVLLAQYSLAECEETRVMLAELYMANADYINNWDLVDVTSYKILGPHFHRRDRKPLYDFAVSGHLWRERISIITTMFFIKKDDFEDTFRIADILLQHRHDLIHKAVGWLLREVGKRDLQAELDYLNPRYRTMPRTMLRYAIEKFDEPLRVAYLKGTA